MDPTIYMYLGLNFHKPMLSMHACQDKRCLFCFKLADGKSVSFQTTSKAATLMELSSLHIVVPPAALVSLHPLCVVDGWHVIGLPLFGCECDVAVVSPFAPLWLCIWC